MPELRNFSEILQLKFEVLTQSNSHDLAPTQAPLSFWMFDSRLFLLLLFLQLPKCFLTASKESVQAACCHLWVICVGGQRAFSCWNSLNFLPFCPVLYWSCSELWVFCSCGWKWTTEDFFCSALYFVFSIWWGWWVHWENQLLVLKHIDLRICFWELHWNHTASGDF